MINRLKKVFRRKKVVNIKIDTLKFKKDHFLILTVPYAVVGQADMDILIKSLEELDMKALIIIPEISYEYKVLNGKESNKYDDFLKKGSELTSKEAIELQEKYSSSPIYASDKPLTSADKEAVNKVIDSFDSLGPLVAKSPPLMYNKPGLIVNLDKSDFKLPDNIGTRPLSDILSKEDYGRLTKVLDETKEDCCTENHCDCDCIPKESCECDYDSYCRICKDSPRTDYAYVNAKTDQILHYATKIEVDLNEIPLKDCDYYILRIDGFKGIGAYNFDWYRSEISKFKFFYEVEKQRIRVENHEIKRDSGAEVNYYLNLINKNPCGCTNQDKTLNSSFEHLSDYLISADPAKAPPDITSIIIYRDCLICNKNWIIDSAPSYNEANDKINSFEEKEKQ